MKTEDVVTIAVLGFALYAMFGKALSKTPPPPGSQTQAQPPVNFIDPDFGISNPTGNWE